MKLILTAERDVFKLNLPQDTYNNCHEFTNNFIISLYEYFQSQMNPALDKDILEDALRRFKGVEPGNAVALRDIYKGFINNQIAVPFWKENLSSVIQTCSLVLFTDLRHSDISHSMIALNSNEWIGANNVSSLGVKDAFDLSGKVQKYNDMGNRMFSADEDVCQGGWYEGMPGSSKMRYLALGSPMVETYAVPLFSSGNLTFTTVPESQDECCIIV